MVTISVCRLEWRSVLPLGKLWWPTWMDTIKTWCGLCIFRTWCCQAITSARGTSWAKEEAAFSNTWGRISELLTNQAMCRTRGWNRGEKTGTCLWRVRKKVLLRDFSLTGRCSKSPAARTKTSLELFNITDDKLPNSERIVQLKGVLC